MKKQIIILNENCNILEFVEGNIDVIKNSLITIDSDQLRVLNNIVMPTVYGRNGDYLLEEYYLVDKQNKKIVSYEIRHYLKDDSNVFVVGNVIFDKSDSSKNYYMPSSPNRTIKCKTMLPKGFKDNPVEPMSYDMLYNYK